MLYQPMPPRRGQVVRFGSSTTPPAVRSPPLHDGHPGVGQVEGSLIPVIGFTCFVKGLKLKLAVLLRQRNLVNKNVKLPSTADRSSYCLQREGQNKLAMFSHRWSPQPFGAFREFQASV